MWLINSFVELLWQTSQYYQPILLHVFFHHICYLIEGDGPSLHLKGVIMINMEVELCKEEPLS